MKKDVSASLTSFAPLRIFSWVVVALMVVAMLYVGWLSISSWAEISI